MTTHEAMKTLEDKLLSMAASVERWEKRLEESPDNEYFAMQVHARKVQYDHWWEIASAIYTDKGQYK